MAVSVIVPVNVTVAGPAGKVTVRVCSSNNVNGPRGSLATWNLRVAGPVTACWQPASTKKVKL